MKRKGESSTADDIAGDIDLASQASETQIKRKNAEEEAGIQRKRKREKSKITDKRGNLRKKQPAKKTEPIDMISELPDSIIHYILSLIRCRKGGARTSLLSKRWRDLWRSYSALTFDQRKFKKPEGIQDKSYNEMFKDFVDQSLQSHLERNLGISKLELHLTSYDLEVALEQWVGLANENKIKELGLCVHMNSSEKEMRRINLPSNVFHSETITGLRLNGCKLKTCSTIELPHLKRLHLQNVDLDEQSFSNIISSCSLIEDLRLICCKGLKRLHVSSLLKLNSVKVNYCWGLKKIELKAPSLQTFWYYGKNQASCKFNLAACKSLTTLTLEDKKMTDDQFRDLFFGFPLLEKLNLSYCLSLVNIRIASQRLKRLVLRGCNNLTEAEIDAPNLLTYEYQGNKMAFPFLNPTSLKEAKLSIGGISAGQLYNSQPEPRWFHNLQSFLGKLDLGFKVVMRTRKKCINIDKDLEEICLQNQREKFLCLLLAGGCKLELTQSSVGTQDRTIIAEIPHRDAICSSNLQQ